MTDLQEQKRAFLDWLDEQDGYYIVHDDIPDRFDDVLEDLNMVGVTMSLNKETDEWETPIRDYRQAVKYGGVLD